MSAVAPVREQRRTLPRAQPGRVTLPRVLRSEWTKLWSLRSTRWSLLAAFMALTGDSVEYHALVGDQQDESAEVAA
jgi:hypothetical protein